MHGSPKDESPRAEGRPPNPRDVATLRASLAFLEAMGVRGDDIERLRELLASLDTEREAVRYREAHALALELDERVSVAVLRTRFRVELLSFDA